jgi:hypothetical protein
MKKVGLISKVCCSEAQQSLPFSQISTEALVSGEASEGDRHVPDSLEGARHFAILCSWKRCWVSGGEESEEDRLEIPLPF